MAIWELLLRVGIGFVTGRKGFKSLISTYINNWNEHGLIQDPSVELRLFVAYDLKYFNTTTHDYKNIPPELAAHLQGIDYFGTPRIQRESAILTEKGVLDAREADLLFGEGYGKKRNAVVYAAVRAGMDALMFIDDDEYPLATIRTDAVASSGLYWLGQGVVSTHLAHIGEADITHGRHCGYISPIPYLDFDDNLSEDLFKTFIDALSNDIINWESLRATIIDDKGVTYADPDILKRAPVEEVPERGGMKFISGANLCLNLKKVDTIAPFYNPPGARGEDTFLSTCLSGNKVLKMPCYTFHDGFLMYRNLLDGVLPRELAPVAADTAAKVKRFAQATRGWVRYKPLLTYITNRDEYEKTIASMRKAFEKTVPAICARFGSDDFRALPEELRYYSQKVEEHFRNFERTKKAWKKAISWAMDNPA